MRGAVSRAADAHLRYLERDGVTSDGKKGRAYSALENEADGRAFIENGLVKFEPAKDANGTVTFDSKNAGTRKMLITGYQVNDDNDGGNYAVTLTSNATPIKPRFKYVSI